MKHGFSIFSFDFVSSVGFTIQKIPPKTGDFKSDSSCLVSRGY
jgi:hypothetical protein